MCLPSSRLPHQHHSDQQAFFKKHCAEADTRPHKPFLMRTRTKYEADVTMLIWLGMLFVSVLTIRALLFWGPYWDP